MGWRAQRMDPDTCDGTPLVGSRCRARSWIYSRIGWRKRLVGEKIALEERGNGRACHWQHPSIEISPVADSDRLGCNGRSFRVERGEQQCSDSPCVAVGARCRRFAAAGGRELAQNIAEWLNETVRLRDTVQALDRPSRRRPARGPYPRRGRGQGNRHRRRQRVGADRAA